MSEESSSLPLAGKRIVVTQAHEQAARLSDLLRTLGAQIIEIPTIEIRPPASWEALDRAIRNLRQFDYLIATSANGVRSFHGRLRAAGKTADDIRGLKIGAIGPATAAAFAKIGLEVNFVPREFRAEGLLETLAGADLRGKAFLIPRAQAARDLLPQVLRERGARVEVVAAYETRRPRFEPGELERRLTPSPDLISFTSSSTARHFTELIAENKLGEKLEGVAAASIGPITSATLRQLNWTVAIEASEYTIPGLVEAIRAYFSPSAP